jgi:2-polyprenyl-6-methoxyphenol hydroxylase-like FAD-dependent oxidoreductase
MGICRKHARHMAPDEAARTWAPRNGRAIVLGGGLSGLLAARVLTDTFEEVMIIERHHSPVAQQVLPQMLSDLARTQLDQLFTGLSSELVADGAAIAVDGRAQFTQGFIHRHLSSRLESFDGVVIQYGCDAVGLVNGRDRCAGVRVLPRSRSAAARTIPAEFVVDAMGPGSRLCLWVDDLSRTHVPCDQQMITHYASRLYQLRDGSLPAATMIDLRPAHPHRAAVMAVENDQYVVTIVDRTSPPRDRDEFDQLLRNLLPQQVAANLASGQPMGPVIRFASAPIRRFDCADSLPPNVVALGDSLCSFDPLEGRSFEAAVLEVVRLVRV